MTNGRYPGGDEEGEAGRLAYDAQLAREREALDKEFRGEQQADAAAEPKVNTDPESLEARFEREFMALANSKAMAILPMTPVEAWIVMVNLQIAVKHPENVGDSERVARAMGERIQGLIAPSGALAEVAQQGWEEVIDAP